MSFEKKWRRVLTSILEQLTDPQFTKMLDYLDQIPQGVKTDKTREKIPDLILQYYGTEGSISEIDEIVREIPRMDSAVQDPLRPFVEKLKERQEERGKKRKREEEEEVMTDATSDQLKTLDQQKMSPPDEKRNTSSWKKSIREVKLGGILETEGFVGKVVQRSWRCSYKTKDRDKRVYFHLAVADETSSVNVKVYGDDRYQQIQEQNSYLFRKLKDNNNGVMVTASSKVSRTRSVDVPEDVETDARKQFNPKSPVLSIKDAKSSAHKTVVSVEGTVTEINPFHMTDVKFDSEREKQHFQLKDETGPINVYMWGGATELSRGLSIGDVVTVTNTKTNKYHDNVSLNSTLYTRIEKVRSVGVHNETIHLMGILPGANQQETHLEAELNNQPHTFVVDSSVLAEAWGLTLDQDFEESLLDKIGLSVDAKIHGNRIINIRGI